MHERVSRLAGTALTLAVLLAACSSGTEQTGDAAPEATPSSSSAPSISASPEASGSARAGGGDARPPVDGTPAPEPPPPGEAPVSAPPSPGLYRYAQEGRGAFGEYPAEGTLRIRAATLAKEGQRQRHVRTVSDDQITESMFVFTKRGVLLEEVTQKVGSGAFAQSFTCTFSPPLRIVELPLEAGRSWKGTSSCQGLDVSFRASFLREERVTVAGTSVDTIVMRATFEAKGDGIEQTTVTTSWISPKYRLIVRSTEESSGRQGAIEYSTRMTETLLNLKPE